MSSTEFGSETEKQTEAAPKVLSEGYYRRLYELEEQHWWFQGTRVISAGLLDRYIKGRTDLQVLDVGCGTGIVLGWLERYALPQAIYGIDLSQYALNFCRQRHYRNLALGSTLALPFEAGSFDLVISADVIQHLPRNGGDHQALAEMARVLRPGGLLYLRTNSSMGVGQVRAEEEASYQRYNRAELLAQFESVGLQVEQASYINLVMSAWSSLKGKIKKIVSRPQTGHGHSHAHGVDHGLAVRLLPPRLAWLNRLLLGLLRLEAFYLAGPGRSLPFGHSQVFVLRKKG